MDAETLRQYLEFYQDLGIKTLYRQAAVAVPAAAPQADEPKGLSNSMELPPLAPKDDTLLKIMEDIGDCRRCKLCEAPKKMGSGGAMSAHPSYFAGKGR